MDTETNVAQKPGEAAPSASSKQSVSRKPARKSRPKRQKSVPRNVYKDPILEAAGFPQPPSAIADKMGKVDRFPDRKVNLEELDDYDWKDPTLLMKDGKPWVPEEHGYRARLCENLVRKRTGLDIWIKVRPEDGINFADSALNISKFQGARVEDDSFGEAQDGVYRNGAFLCLAPLEVAMAQQARELKDAEELVSSSMLQSAERLQQATGGDPKHSRFSAGPTMSRRQVRIPREEMLDRAKMINTGRHSVTVPAKIS